MSASPSPLREEIRRLERLREERPGSLAFVRLAEAYRSAGEHDLALEVLEEGGESAPEHPAVDLVAARIHRDLGRREDERRALERVLEADPENRAARNALERLTGPGEREDEAPAAAPRSSARRASHSPEERDELLEQLGGVAREDWWNDDGAVQDGGPDVDDPPGSDRSEDGPVTETMARLYARQGLWEEAEAMYGELVERRSGDPRLARCLELVREREVPPRPPGGREPRGSGPAAPSSPSSSRSAGGPRRESPPGGPRAGAAAPNMRAHLRALLRGGGIAGSDRRSPGDGPARPVADRLGDRPEGSGDRPEGRREDRSAEEMEELLRRWQRAARRGRDE